MLTELTMMAAGLGFFFLGGRFLSDALTRLTGRRARAFVVRHTHHAGRAFGIGVAIAAVTQSTQVTTFLMVGMIKAGLIRLRRAMIVLSGTNVGVCGLLFVASFDIQPLVLAILGISGILYARATNPALRNPMAAVVGGALLIYGLGLLRHAVAPVAEVAIVTDLLVIAGRHDVLIFALSVGLVLLLQSATAVGMLGVTLAGAGLFGIEQAMLVAFGANLGNGLNMFLLSRHLTGRARQMAAFQVSLGLVGTAVVIPLLMIERAASLPLGPAALITTMTQDPGRGVAWSYLLFNLLGAGGSMLFLGRISDTLARLWPSTAIESDAQPAFLDDLALGDPEGALDLAILEQRRLIGQVEHLTAALTRDGALAQRRRVIALRQDGLRQLMFRIDLYLTEIAGGRLSPGGYERLNLAIAGQRRLDAVVGTLGDLVDLLVDQMDRTDAIGRVATAIMHGVDAVMMTLGAAARSGDADDRGMLAAVVGDRGEIMTRLRRQYLSAEAEMPPADRARLLNATNLCERLFWLLASLVDGLEATLSDAAANGMAAPLSAVGEG